MNSPIVLDASVILKWFKKSDESQVESAIDYLTKHEGGNITVCASAVLLYELYNTLARHLESEAENIEEFLERARLKIYTLKTNHIKSGFALVRKHRISFYDASYVVLAHELGCDLITADKKLVERVKLPYVKLLS